MTNEPRLAQALEELLVYFDLLESQEWPSTTVMNGDGPESGLVDEELYNILIRLVEQYHAYQEGETTIGEEPQRAVRTTRLRHDIW